MSKLQKILAGIAAVCLIFFGFIVVRIGAAPNDDSVKLAKIPKDQQLTKDGYKDAYPLEYESFMKNNEMHPSPTGYGGSDKVDHLKEQPEAIENFKGYKFALQYDDDRGHTYAGIDILESKRRPGQKGSCIVCKSSYMYDVYFKESGWDFATKPFDEIAAPIKDDEWFGCSSCHDPETMELRVYQQGFVEAMARRGVDISKASHNEMRAYVCGQCHNEYYFAKEDGRVVEPWDNGFDAEEIYQYYQDGHAGGFKQDWIHADSKTPMLKAQHPDYETWQDSIHAMNGVTCVDCHMPYMRKDGQKYTSHWMTNPLLTPQESCQKCHQESAETLTKRVKTIGDNTFKLQRIAGQTVAKAHQAIKAAMDAGATDEQLADARQTLREAQWYWDFVAAESSMGFHNPDKQLRVLGLSIDKAHTAIAQANAIAKGSL
ncbi:MULTISPECIES: ammonia-forming cytochrome c nitrite reductase subunit c552 [Selenomonas]|uniref:nitrite reductase (cytochrome; ammonia-forming) n=1 Tax=Selenomonas ruminis TaxID=2593411 RepID=A0A5D6W541_9FIRM|nr:MULTISPECIES: ammonia-forming cytochrome c nitrite reductase subunit c552 [unclassified Selenomonas]MBQ1866818.1 ammonia-forming cytochrome c nitrite reductase subunit c552 [Selenomonas sp.]TYZ21928.1 ammonia-forming cytochrome c nitrite reductase subunit c552 [Selenomonas sp. mPRGC5]